ncbi:DUF6893 family small protein [Arthrobacter crystallopoietes]
MRTIGTVTVAVLAAVALALAVAGIRSIPDIQRYLRINRM